MVAGQSCIAGPSVCFPSCYARLLSGLHLPFFIIGNKKSAYRRGLWKERVCGCLHGASAHTLRASGSSRARTPSAPIFLSSNLAGL